MAYFGVSDFRINADITNLTVDAVSAKLSRHSTEWYEQWDCSSFGEWLTHGGYYNWDISNDSFLINSAPYYSTDNFVYRTLNIPAGGKLIFKYKTQRQTLDGYMYVKGAGNNILYTGSSSDWKEETVTLNDGITNDYIFIGYFKYNNYGKTDYAWIDHIRWGPFYREGYYTNGTYTSNTYTSMNSSNVRISWLAYIPTGTTCTIEARTSRNNSWSDWVSIPYTGYIHSPDNNFDRIQVRATLTTIDDSITPILSSINIITHDEPVITTPTRRRGTIRSSEITELRDAINNMLPKYGLPVITTSITGNQVNNIRDTDFIEIASAIKSISINEDNTTWNSSYIKQGGTTVINVDHLIELQEKLVSIVDIAPVAPSMRQLPYFTYLSLNPPGSISSSSSSQSDNTIDVSWIAATSTNPNLEYSWYPSYSKDVAAYEVWYSNGTDYWLYTIISNTGKAYYEISHEWDVTWNGYVNICTIDKFGNKTDSMYPLSPQASNLLDHYELNYKLNNKVVWNGLGGSPVIETKAITWYLGSQCYYYYDSNRWFYENPVTFDMLSGVTNISCGFYVSSGTLGLEWMIVYYNEETNNWLPTSTYITASQYDTTYSFNTTITSSVVAKFIVVPRYWQSSGTWGMAINNLSITREYNNGSMSKATSYTHTINELGYYQYRIRSVDGNEVASDWVQTSANTYYCGCYGHCGNHSYSE